MRSPIVALLLIFLLVVMQWQLWTGRGSVRDVAQLQEKLAEGKIANLRVADENTGLAAEVNDLKEGLEMVEERARQELGMVKPNEVFVHIVH